jgi:molybdopterin molybdotransferase
LRIVNRTNAGDVKACLFEKNTCIEVATGASLPDGANFVLQKELYRVEKDAQGNIFAVFDVDKLPKNNSIHPQGSDAQAGETLIKEGTFLTPAHIAVLATVGKMEVNVKKLPPVRIISTGDELTEKGKMPLPHQIRPSNAYTIFAVLQKFFPSADIEIYFAGDSVQAVESPILTAPAGTVFISTGAVSVGEKDLVPEILEKNAFETYFHKVKHRPGKPFLFAGKKSSLFFGLPGNPLSTFISLYRYIIPAFHIFLGKKTAPYQVSLAENYPYSSEMTFFLPVKILDNQAFPVPPNGSGDLISITEADGFVELPGGIGNFEKGRILKYFAL